DGEHEARPRVRPAHRRGTDEVAGRRGPEQVDPGVREPEHRGVLVLVDQRQAEHLLVEGLRSLQVRHEQRDEVDALRRPAHVQASVRLSGHPYHTVTTWMPHPCRLSAMPSSLWFAAPTPDTRNGHQSLRNRPYQTVQRGCHIHVVPAAWLGHPRLM